MSDDDMADYDDDMIDADDYVDDFDADLPDDDAEMDDDDDPNDAMDYGLKESTEIRRVRSFEVLSEADLLGRSKALIDSVKEVLGLPHKSAAILLLRHFKWSKDKLLEEYPDNPELINKLAGVTDELEKKPKSKTKKKYECLICTEEYPGKDTYALGCGHRYCLGCWKSYLEVALKDGPAAIGVHCPAPKCFAVVHDKAFKKLLPKPVYATYKKFVAKGLVTDNPTIKFCPRPGCSNAVRCERKNRKEAVSCNCGFAFCFQCNDFEIGDHMPATCENVRMWSERASSESENIKWLLANTKRCPQCGKPIEKNGGCMHMTCRKQSGGCGHEFCWLCRGPWTEHGSETGGYYACNKYAASNAKDEDVKNDQIRTELEYYMFYYHRYESHKNAMSIADEQRRNAEKKSDEILGKWQVRTQDTKFLQEATEQLLQNRRVLKWSYVYGFYLKDKPQEKQLFEFLQEDLEKHTNRLSEVYETPVERIEDYAAFMKWKEDVANYTRVTKRFLDKFVEGVMRGLMVE